MTDREKLILYRVISYGVTFLGLALFAFGSSTHPDNATLQFFGLLFVFGGMIFMLITDRCPYCGRKLNRGPIPHYCPYCGEYIF